METGGRLMRDWNNRLRTTLLKLESVRPVVVEKKDLWLVSVHCRGFLNSVFFFASLAFAKLTSFLTSRQGRNQEAVGSCGTYGQGSGRASPRA